MTTGDQMDRPPYKQDGGHYAPGCSSFAQRIASMEAEMPGDLSYGADQTIADMLTCIRDQQAALQDLLDCHEHEPNRPAVKIGIETLARWRIEP